MGTQNYNGPKPVNQDTGFKIKIKDLVETIKELTGFGENLPKIRANPTISLAAVLILAVQRNFTDSRLEERPEVNCRLVA